jgi:hypothetical protein
MLIFFGVGWSGDLRWVIVKINHILQAGFSHECGRNKDEKREACA